MCLCTLAVCACVPISSRSSTMTDCDDSIWWLQMMAMALCSMVERPGTLSECSPNAQPSTEVPPCSP